MVERWIAKLLVHWLVIDRLSRKSKVTTVNDNFVNGSNFG